MSKNYGIFLARKNVQLLFFNAFSKNVQKILCSHIRIIFFVSTACQSQFTFFKILHQENQNWTFLKCPFSKTFRTLFSNFL